MSHITVTFGCIDYIVQSWIKGGFTTPKTAQFATQISDHVCSVFGIVIKGGLTTDEGRKPAQSVEQLRQGLLEFGTGNVLEQCGESKSPVPDDGRPARGDLRSTRHEDG